MSKVLLYCVQENEINKQKRNKCPLYDLSPIITHANCSHCVCLFVSRIICG